MLRRRSGDGVGVHMLRRRSGDGIDVQVQKRKVIAYPPCIGIQRLRSDFILRDQEYDQGIANEEILKQHRLRRNVLPDGFGVNSP